MTGYVAQLEKDLVAAARRQAKTRPVRRHWRSLLLSTTLFVTVGAATAGGTLFVVRGGVIPAPAERDVPREQLPVGGSATVLSLRAPDPAAGRPPWALRLSRSRTGLLCTTVGQVSGGRFGLVGLDGRFRALAEGIADGCGEVRANRASLIGARVFDADRRDEVRTVVNGVAGSSLRKVTVTAGGTRRDVAVGKGGAFAAAIAGYPEDVGAEVTLAFADGHTERHPFGRGRFVVTDPLGGAAWKTQVFAFGTSPGQKPDSTTCVNFQHTRDAKPRPTFGPAACGDLGGGRYRPGYFFRAMRIPRGYGGVPALTAKGNWDREAPRTAVWGLAGDDVRAVAVIEPGNPPAELVIAPNRAFLALFPPTVDARRLTVRVTFKDGRTEERRGRANLRPYPSPP